MNDEEIIKFSKINMEHEKSKIFI